MTSHWQLGSPEWCWSAWRHSCCSSCCTTRPDSESFLDSEICRQDIVRLATAGEYCVI